MASERARASTTRYLPTPNDIENAERIAEKVLLGLGAERYPERHIRERVRMDADGLSLAEIAEAEGVSRQRVNQILGSAIKKCRAWADAHNQSLERMLGIE